MGLGTSHRMAESSTLGLLQCEVCHWKPGRLDWRGSQRGKRGGYRGTPLGGSLSHSRQRHAGTVGYLKGLDSEYISGVDETRLRQLRNGGVDSDLGALLKPKMAVPLTQMKETSWTGLWRGGRESSVLSMARWRRQHRTFCVVCFLCFILVSGHSPSPPEEPAGMAWLMTELC